MINSFRDLIVWKKSKDLAVTIFKITNDFPPEEKFGLTNQIRRASVSIPSNIAEGSKKTSRKEFAKYLRDALGSTAELITQLEISKELVFLSEKDYEQISSAAVEIEKMLNALVQKLSKPV